MPGTDTYGPLHALCVLCTLCVKCPLYVPRVCADPVVCRVLILCVLCPDPAAAGVHHNVPQEYIVAPPDQLMQVLMGVIKAHMADEPDSFKVR